MDKLPSHGQAQAGGASHSLSSSGGDGGGPGDRKSSSPGQAWGRTVSLPGGPATRQSTVMASSISRESAGSTSSTSASASPIDPRDTKTGLRVPPVKDAPCLRTEWLARALGTAWTQPALGSRPRAAEADQCGTPADAAKWVASVMDDTRVSVEDAMVCAVLLARKICSAMRSPETSVVIDAIVAASLRAPAPGGVDKAAAMLAGLCRSMEAQWISREPAPHFDGLPPAHWRIALVTRLLAPNLPPGDLARHVREGHAQRLMQALVQALCPPRAGGDSQAVALLPSTHDMFRDHPGELGLLALARGIEARVRSQASEPGPAREAGVAGVDGDVRPDRWPLPLAQGVDLAPLASPQAPRRLATQAMLVHAIHLGAHRGDEAQASAVLAALSRRIVREGRAWTVPVLLASACGFASAVWRFEKSQAEDDDRDPNFATVLEDELDVLLDLPEASSLSPAGRNALYDGFSLAEEPVDWIYRQSRDGKGFGLDTEGACELLDVALQMRGAVEADLLLAELASDCLAQAHPRAAIAAVGSLLRHSMDDIEHLALIAAGRQIGQHLRAMARRGGAAGELDAARLQWVPAVYRGFAQALHERWSDMRPQAPRSDLSDFVANVRQVCATLRGEAKVWQNESRVSLQGRADHLPGLLEGLAKELDALAVQACKRLGITPAAGDADDATLEDRVSAALARFLRPADGKDTKDGKGSPRSLGPAEVRDAVRQLGALWSPLRRASGSEEAELAGTVFLSIVGRQLASLALHPQGLDLIASSTSHLVADAGPVWQGLFLRELMTGLPQAQHYAFTGVVLGLHHEHKGLGDSDWALLLDYLLEARLPDDAAGSMGMMLVFNAAGQRRDQVLAAMTQMVRHLALRPGTVVAQARLARLAFEALWTQVSQPASAANPLGGLAWPPRPVLEDQALALVREPRTVARLVTVTALALRDLAQGRELAQHWVFDAVGAVDAALVAAQSDVTGPKAQARVAQERTLALARVTAMGEGLAIAVASGRTGPTLADEVRTFLALPAKAGVAPEVQEALWRGGRQALDTRADASDLEGLADATSMKPGGHEGSKSRRTGTGRDREDPPDEGYSGKRKEGRKPAAPQVPVPPRVTQDPAAQQAQQLREGFTQALEVFSAALADPSIRLPLSAPRKALVQWLQVPDRGARSLHAIAGTGLAPAVSHHPADADGIGWQLEQVFRAFAFFVDGQVLAWHGAGHDLRALAGRVGREMRQWEALSSPHAKRVLRMLRRALEVLERESRNPRPHPVPAVTPVSRETKTSGETKAVPRTPPVAPSQGAAGMPVVDGADDLMHDDADIALALSLSLQPVADTSGDDALARSLDWPPRPADLGEPDAWDVQGAGSGRAVWDDPMDPWDL